MAAEPTKRERGLRDILKENLEQTVRGGDLARMMGPANASASAQRVSDGLGIQNVRRGIGVATLTGTVGVTTITDVSWAPLPNPLSLTMTLSGRPIRVRIAGLVSAGAGTAIVISVFMRGVEITGTANGLIYSASTTVLSLSGEELVMAPAPGEATFEVRAFRGTANGIIYTDGVNNRFQLSVEEQ